MQHGNHAGNLCRALAQACEVFRLLDLNRDQVGLVGQKTEQIERLQNAQHLPTLLRHDNPMNPATQHHGHCVAEQISGPNLDQ